MGGAQGEAPDASPGHPACKMVLWDAAPAPTAASGCSRLPPLHQPHYRSTCCAFPRHSMQPLRAADREVSSCPSPRLDAGTALPISAGFSSSMASPSPRSVRTCPLPACFALNPTCTAPQALGSRVRNTLSAPNCSAQKAVAACCLFSFAFFFFPPFSLQIFL